MSHSALKIKNFGDGAVRKTAEALQIKETKNGLRCILADCGRKTGENVYIFRKVQILNQDSGNGTISGIVQY